MRELVSALTVAGFIGAAGLAVLGCVETSELGMGEPTSSTQLVLLGTGNPNADPDHSGPAAAVVVAGTPYLIDAGPGVVRRAAAAQRAGVQALNVKNLGIAFLTHLHSDHTMGLPDLIFTPWVLEREEPLRLFGPPGTRAMAEHILKAYEEDIRIRIEGLQPANTEGYKVEASDVLPGMIYEDGNVRVTAFPVKHGDWEYAYGFRFETADRTIVFSGDAAPSESIVENCAGCDVLVHEVYAKWGFDRREPEWKRYHASAHTSGPALGELAARARPATLVLSHHMLWGATVDQLLAEIRGGGYTGRLVYGKDLDVF